MRKKGNRDKHRQRKHAPYPAPDVYIKAHVKLYTQATAERYVIGEQVEHLTPEEYFARKIAEAIERIALDN